MSLLRQRASRRATSRLAHGFVVADEFIESYVCWREACEDVHSAYRRWGDCQPQQRDLGFATYRAALEREERAAGVHLEWAERLRAVAHGERT
jgi:hypothetical protein